MVQITNIKDEAKRIGSEQEEEERNGTVNQTETALEQRVKEAI